MSADHAGDSITLKDIQAARVAHRRRLRSEIGERKVRIADFFPALVIRPTLPVTPAPLPSAEVAPRPKGTRLRTYSEGD